MAPPTPDDITTLNKVSDTLVKLINDLLTHLESLGSKPELAYNPDHSKIPSIGLAHDATLLIKAHSTKVSLLIINEPFTPTAITKVLQELIGAAVPSLASAASACDAARYTAGFTKELRGRAQRVLRCLRDLIQIIPIDGKILSLAQKDGSRGSIAMTSVLWSACDQVANLHTLGVRGLLDEKISQHRAILEDIKEELKEWKEENEDPDSDSNSSGDDAPEFDDGLDDAQAQLDELMSAQKIPKDRTDIRNQLSPCIARLGLLSLLYKATLKRRIKELPELPPPDTDKETLAVVRRVNEAYAILKNLPDDFGDLVAAFYKLDAPLVESTRAQCFRQACAVGDLLRKPWTTEEDIFSKWIDKFQAQMNGPTDVKA